MGLNFGLGDEETGSLRCAAMTSEGGLTSGFTYNSQIAGAHFDGYASNFHLYRASEVAVGVDIRASTPAAFQITNFWMSTITAAGFHIVPKHGVVNSFSSQGLLVQTDNLTFPGPQTLTNAADFPTLPAPWANYAIGKGHALYVGSTFAGDSGTNLEWFTQSTGGRCDFTYGPPAYTTGRRVFNIAADSVSFPPAQVVDLDGSFLVDAKVPGPAKTVTIAVIYTGMTATDTNGLGFSVASTANPGTALYAHTQVLSGQPLRIYTELMTIPINTGSGNVNRELNFSWTTNLILRGIILLQPVAFTACRQTDTPVGPLPDEETVEPSTKELTHLVARRSPMQRLKVIQR